MQGLVGESRTAAPLGFFAVVIESGNAGAVGAEMQLQVEFESVLIPGGITRAGGIAQDRARLSELLESIQGRRMLESGQGTGK